jgi:hypothetical protein
MRWMLAISNTTQPVRDGLRLPAKSRCQAVMQLQKFLFACAVAFVFLVSARAAAQTRLFSVSSGSAIVREWDSSTGAFLNNPAVLTDVNGQVTTSSDIEFDGEYFYSVTPDGPWIKRFDSGGHYLGFITLREASGVPVGQTQIGLAADGRHFYTIAANDPRIRKFTRAGYYIEDVGWLRDSLGLNYAQVGLATDGQYFYTIAAADYRIRRFDLTGDFLGDVAGFNNAGTPNGNNTGLAVFAATAPILTVLPTNQTVLVGDDTLLLAEIMGVRPATCQWWFKGRKLPLQTNSILYLTDIRLRSRGQYQIEVRNSLGIVRSETVRVNVVVPPTIILQPRSITARDGARVKLRVTAKGSKPFAYQWFKDGTFIEQATNRVCTFLHVAASDAGSYSVRVSNAGASQDSIPASLVVTP